MNKQVLRILEKQIGNAMVILLRPGRIFLKRPDGTQQQFISITTHEVI